MTGYTFPQLIDFTRTSAATFVNSSGNIASTPQSRNLLTFTQEFDNAAWTKTNAVVYPFDPNAISLGSQLATNGDFSAGSTGWSTQSGWTISGGAASVNSAVAGSTYMRTTTPTTSGRWYSITFTVTSYTSGTLAVAAGSATAGTITAAGTYTQLIQANSADGAGVYAVGSSTVATVDNISVRELNNGTLAPDGTFTADTLIAAAGTGFTPRVADVSVSTVNGAAHTVSIYAKAGTYSFLQIYISSQASEWVNFTLTGAGTASANGSCTATITALSGGWYRCTMSYTAGGTDRRPFFLMAASGSATRAQTWNPAGTETVFIWGAQLEQASAATDYTRNFGGLFPPRFDYDPVSLAPRGLLVEEQRTNLVLRSEEFDAGNWTKSRTTATANATTSPDGTVDADKIIETTDAGTHRVFQQAAKAASVLTRTFSVYLKAAERTRARIQMSNSNESVSTSADVNLSAGTITNASNSGDPSVVAVGSSITNAGNGWYRCTITATYDATITNPGAFVFIHDGAGSNSYTGDGTSGIFVWGAQWEDGAFATSYIPTVASQVTRSADVAAINAPNFASWFNSVEGTMVVEASSFVSTALVAVYTPFGLNNGTSTNQLFVFNYNNKWGAASTVGGVNQCDMQATGSYTANVPAKLAFAYKANDFAFSVNGAAPLTDGSGTVPSGVNQAILGSGINNALNGHIRSIRFYPTRLTNAQLQALTA